MNDDESRYAPRRFKLVRKIDDSGVSGTGHVADGVVFWTGEAVLVWRTEYASINIYQSLDHLEKVHGHGGHTIVEWIDA